MRKEIVADIFDPESLSEAIRFLEDYERWAKEKGNELCRRLADIGANIARIHFDGGYIDGNDDVTVTVIPNNEGYQIIANGESVCFLEFGTGVAAGNGYDTSVIDPPVDISPASWSKTEGSGAFYEHWYWYYNKRRYTMTTPRMGMYHAVREIEQQLPKIAEEVFMS